MLNSYSDAQLMNESFVFYTSTNTFKNPAFVAYQNHKADEEARGLARSDCSHGLPQEKLFIKQQDQQKQQQPQHAPADPSILSAKSERSSRASMTSTTKGHERNNNTTTTSTKRKLIDFCDNFAFSLRGKVFIMETNFKRRMRGLRQFLDKRVLPLISPASHYHPHYYSHHPNRANQHDKATTTRNLGNLLRDEQQQQQQQQQQQRQLLRGQHHTEPISAEALGVQQGRILTRLERIKRDSQRLFNMQQQQQQEATILEDYYDRREGLPAQVPDVPIWLEASRAGRGDSAETLAAPVLEMDGVQASSTAYPKKARAPQTSSPQGKGGERWSSSGGGVGSRWSEAAISSGRQIRQAAAHALTSPKKTCIVCYERAPNIVTLPCEHGDICSECFIEIIYMAVKNSQYPLRCVLCRQKVERIRCSRRLMLSVIKRNRTPKSNGNTTNSGGTGKSKTRSYKLPF